MATRSAKQIRRIAEILKMCRPLIHRNYMICYALTNLQLHKQINLTEKMMVKRYLDQVLEGQQSVLAWLWNTGTVPLGKYANHHIEMIDYRERWIDHMVTYLEVLSQEILQDQHEKMQSRKDQNHY